MKKILINIHYLETGGAESSLIGLLHALNPEMVAVDLMLDDRRGELMKYVPEWVNVLEIPEAYAMIERPIIDVIRAGFIKIAAARVWAKIKYGLYRRKNKPEDGSAIFGYIGRYVTPLLPGLSYLGEYDAAVSYLTPHDIVLKKVKAKKKICWIHTDYSSIDVDKMLELPVWDGYDKIVSISDKVTETFVEVFPELKDKIAQIKPVLSESLIKGLSTAFVPDDMKKIGEEINFLTIGRYCHAKNLESIPAMCRMICDKGIDLKWYIIGYGAGDEYIREAIDQNGMEKRVILLGKKENPYPYIKSCDWYVQPSRYEGNCIAVKEAQILCKPVIITRYPTSGSQIEDGVDGMIVPMDASLAANRISEIIGSNMSELISNNLGVSQLNINTDVEAFMSLL